MDGTTEITESQSAYSKHWHLIAAAQDELESAGGLLRAAAGAMRAGQFEEVRSGTRAIVDAAQKSLGRALDHLHNIGYECYGEDALRVITEIYKVHGTLCVIDAALSAEKEVSGRGMVGHPIAEALDVAADVVGEDCEQGISLRAEELLVKIRQGAPS